MADGESKSGSCHYKVVPEESCKSCLRNLQDPGIPDGPDPRWLMGNVIPKVVPALQSGS